MSYQEGQMVLTSTGKTARITKMEHWEIDGKIFHNSREAYQLGKPTYVPYEVELGSKVVKIGHKNLVPLRRVGLSIKIEDYERVKYMLDTLGIEFNFS